MLLAFLSFLLKIIIEKNPTSLPLKGESASLAIESSNCKNEGSKNTIAGY